MTRALSILALFASSISAFAHGGHGITSAAHPLHYLLEIAHLAPLALVVAGAVLVARRTRAKQQR